MLDTPGMLQRLAQWLTAGPPPGLRRPRPILIGSAPDHVQAVAGVVLAELTVLPATDPTAGAALVDREVDSGCDLLMLAAPDTDEIAATVAIAALTGEEPVRALGFDPGMADEEWVRRAVAVRDGLRLVEAAEDQEAVLTGLADPVLATAVGVIEQAARRRTPLVLDGPTPLAAAVVVAHFGELDPQTCLIAADDRRAAVAMAGRVLGLRPVLDLGRPSGDGVAALLLLPLLRAAQLVEATAHHHTSGRGGTTDRSTS